MSRYGPREKELSADLQRIALREIGRSGDERAILVGRTSGVRKVQAVIHKHEMDDGLHLARLTKERANKHIEAILHIGLRPGDVHVHLLAHSDDLYRLRIRAKPRGVQWSALTRDSIPLWNSIWGPEGGDEATVHITVSNTQD